MLFRVTDPTSPHNPILPSVFIFYGLSISFLLLGSWNFLLAEWIKNYSVKRKGLGMFLLRNNINIRVKLPLSYFNVVCVF